MRIVSGHTRLYRRGVTDYHRCAVPTNTRKSYGKREETFTLKTKDYGAALKRVRLAAIQVDQRFEAHRRKLKAPHPIRELSQEAVDRLCEVRFQESLTRHEKTNIFIM